MSRHPRAHESPARAAQLERIKAARRAKREAQPPRPRAKLHSRGHFHFCAVPVAEPPVVTAHQIITELQRQAMGGVAPRMAVYDLARPAHYPTAARICEQYGRTWADVAREAELRPTRV